MDGSEIFLEAHKMNGAGNDFLVIDGRNLLVASLFEENGSQLSKQLGDRHFGIGFDQLLLLLSPSDSNIADIHMKIYNSDGSTSGMCGNGARCVALYLYHFSKPSINKNNIVIETTSRIVKAEVLDSKVSLSDISSLPVLRLYQQQVRVEMGVPEKIDIVSLNYQEHKIVGTGISMGNPHFVIFLDENQSFLGNDLSKVPVDPIGNFIQLNSNIKANIEFVLMNSPSEVDSRVYEIGSCETLSCGSGACAIGVATFLRHINCNQSLPSQINVVQPGGLLSISWVPTMNSQNIFTEPVYLSGPATYVGTVSVPICLKKNLKDSICTAQDLR